jgi:hypothetical protein
MWINYIHSNTTVPPGTFGGSICMCEACIKNREPIPEKTAIEIMQEAQLSNIERKNDEDIRDI